MSEKLHLDPAAEREANEVGAKFMNSSDVVGDMSRAFGTDLSAVRIHSDGDADSRASQRGVDAFSTGSDVFFARGAFDRNDSASRGLLAHELTHSMQQGLGGIGGVQTAAPAGAAQGGLLDWFRRHFGKTETRDEGNAEPENVQNPEEDVVNDIAPPENGDAEIPAEENVEAEEAVPEIVAPGLDPIGTLDAAVQQLRSSEKIGGLKNSRKFDRVSTATDDVLTKLNTTFTGKPEQDNTALAEIIASFDGMIQACKDYLNRSAWSDKGEKRQDIVRELKKLAEADRAGFVHYSASRYEGTPAANAIEVLTASRQRTLQLKDRNERDLKHYGNAASYLAKIESGMLEGTATSGFFKAEESFIKREGHEQRLDALEIVQSRTPISEEKYNEIKEIITKTHSFSELKKMEEYGSNREFHEYVDAVAAANVSINTVDANLTNPLKKGESLSLSKRNVAASRLAEILGVGDLVAKSETVKLVDANSGKSKVGNLMQGAKGVEVKEYLEGTMKKNFKAQLYRGRGINDITNEGIDDQVTPQFVKSLISLQILDNIAAQEDRHSGNYFAQIVNGKLGKVQGIDNDFSFTSRTMDWGDGGMGRIGAHGINILDKEGNMRIPYMDKTLADNIMAVNVEDLRIIMADVLEPWAIDALCTRFQQIKDAIEKDQKKNPGRYLEKDEDWGDPEVFQTLRNAHVQSSSKAKFPKNYVSALLMGADLSEKKYGGTQDFRMWTRHAIHVEEGERELEKVWSALWDANKNDSEKFKGEIKKYLQEVANVPGDTISYLEKSGQLLDISAVKKNVADKYIKIGQEKLSRELEAYRDFAKEYMGKHPDMDQEEFKGILINAGVSQEEITNLENDGQLMNISLTKGRTYEEIVKIASALMEKDLKENMGKNPRLDQESFKAALTNAGVAEKKITGLEKSRQMMNSSALAENLTAQEYQGIDWGKLTPEALADQSVIENYIAEHSKMKQKAFKKILIDAEVAEDKIAELEKTGQLMNPSALNKKLSIDELRLVALRLMW